MAVGIHKQKTIQNVALFTEATRLHDIVLHLFDLRYNDIAMCTGYQLSAACICNLLCMITWLLFAAIAKKNTSWLPGLSKRLCTPTWSVVTCMHRLSGKRTLQPGHKHSNVCISMPCSAATSTSWQAANPDLEAVPKQRLLCFSDKATPELCQQFSKIWLFGKHYMHSLVCACHTDCVTGPMYGSVCFFFSGKEEQNDQGTLRQQKAAVCNMQGCMHQTLAVSVSLATISTCMC